MDFKPYFTKPYYPLWTAIIIGLLAVTWYVISGKGNLNANVKKLEQSANVEKITQAQSNRITIKCKNGKSYEIVFKEGQTKFDHLINNRCGALGGVAE